ncbi:hypothetical protein MSS93_05165 [Deinococcus radiodurans]|nr:hypothetical protein MSS93_05165 [Deinococcus radiodurans]
MAGAVRLGLSVAGTLPVSAGLLLLGGSAVAVASIAAMTQLQEGAPATSRGAVLGAVSSLLAGAAPLGLGLATATLPALGLSGVLQGTGVVLLLLGLGRYYVEDGRAMYGVLVCGERTSFWTCLFWASA